MPRNPLSPLLKDHGESVEVAGATTWLELAEALRPDRRPVVMTDPHASIASTIASGGVGDTSLHYGLAAASVIELELIAADVSRTVTRDDELFEYVVCGRGLLGAIGRVRLETLRRPPMLVGHRVAWSSLDDAIRACVVIRQKKLYEIVRLTLVWSDPLSVTGTVANFVDRPRTNDRGLALLGAHTSTPIELVDWFDTWSTEHSNDVAIDLALPLTGVGLVGWRSIEALVRSSGIVAFLTASPMLPLVPEERLPLAPLSPTDASLVVSLRLSPDAVARFQPVLDEIMRIVVDHQGRLAAGSLDAPDLEMQFGYTRVSRWREHQRLVGPVAR
jgi:FAD/FMN-containing dehydrogenase